MPIYVLLVFAVVLLDQSVKFFVLGHIPLNHSEVLVNNVFSLAHVRNYGAAWSMLQGQQWFFTLISIIAIVVVIYYFIKLWKNWGYALGLTLILGGTIGNFVDRLRLGYVIDMFELDFINFPIFNVADCALTVGVIIILIVMLRDDSL
ncbi:lipoprotein signal peptidase [Ligilactobacillus acidipiscis DSM 15836]|uniref:Lipoprotein signal peptidase n=1 Tax=Ligilactobacillus acidipiscis DSM 15836 TaxID=1423716 RepID=A0ABR5PMJ1_9LACO|nr:signal peptidase II [Ligilactobacillus acidipiscis]KRM31486.1 lipoprotein signal peptidase [Ligilactobacillus acidipiscis DSM 15836]GAW63176.1 lipoprotein signal peptidase [Ligilactobacillus acidipiscis]GEN20118.1 lipoprotein signal peptidase [Ligilactobacillus acidipiscis]